MADDNLESELQDRLRRLNARMQGIVVGLIFGIGLFVATIWLVIKGGDPVGPHLSLLGYYFPGYTVTWTGSFLGLAYGFATGFVVAYCAAAIYNAIARFRQG